MSVDLACKASFTAMVGAVKRQWALLFITFFACGGIAQAQAPVTLYGRIYGGIESVRAEGGGASFGARNRVSDYSSFVGFKGTEDIAPDYKIFYQLESAFRIDSNNSTYAARNSGVGVQGPFGSVVLGRWDTPFKTTATAINPYGDLTLSGINAVLHDRLNFDRREQNNVQYWSPVWEGVQGRVSYAANESRSSVRVGNSPNFVTLNPYSTTFSITYTTASFYVGYANERHGDQYRDYNVAAGTAASNIPGASERGEDLFGSVNVGPVKLGFILERIRKDTGVAGQNVRDLRAFLTTLTYTMGKHQFMFSQQRANGGALELPGALQPECKHNALGYFYNFTKRSSFLAQWVRTDNNATGRCDFGQNVLAAPAGADLRGTAVGLRHLF